MDFALNQKTAPKLGFAAFLDLAAKLGCVGVEPRNDLGRPFFDGIEPVRAGEMARERDLRFVGLRARQTIAESSFACGRGKGFAAVAGAAYLLG
jgi:predicted xylose isomerase-like sugar epimerase